MSNIAIQVDGISKRYRIGSSRRGYGVLRERIVSLACAPFRLRAKQSDSDISEFWALDDVSFQVKHGEVFGVVGPNGAGKSTLLKILSRITEPTRGHAELYGRVGSLLEVGTGFHPELTGRENIYLNGAVLGMRKSEIDRRFDQIVEFSEISSFLDTPVKHYSSGMYTRLAFSVAAHLEPEILIVDEVLAVGDAAFQQRCLGKMHDVAKTGRTVLFVSHNMDAVQQLCTTALLLDHGRLSAIGDTEAVISTYLNKHYSETSHFYKSSRTVNPSMIDKAILLEAQLIGTSGTTSAALRFGEPFSIRLLWHHREPMPSACYYLRVRDARGRLMFAVNSLGHNLTIDGVGHYSVTCSFDHNVLVPGEYFVSVGCSVRPHGTIHEIDPCLILTVSNATHEGVKTFNVVGRPAFAPHASWRQLHAR